MEDIGEETTILLAANGVRRSLTSGQVLMKVLPRGISMSKEIRLTLVLPFEIGGRACLD